VLVELDDTIYAIGGTNDKSILSDIEALDVHSGSESAEWTQELSMPSPRTEHAAAVVGGRIWVSGGFDGDEILR
jgi:outer membrane protein assembly factor BamB